MDRVGRQWSTPMDQRSSRSPRMAANPFAIVTGQASNPVWSPDGDLIVYGGPLVAGQTTLAWVRPDGTSVDLPEHPPSSRRLSLPARWEGSRLSADRLSTGLLAAQPGCEDDASADPPQQSRSNTDVRHHSRRERDRVRSDARQFRHRPHRSAEVTRIIVAWTSTERLQPCHSYQPTIWPRGTRPR